MLMVGWILLSLAGVSEASVGCEKISEYVRNKGAINCERIDRNTDSESQEVFLKIHGEADLSLLDFYPSAEQRRFYLVEALKNNAKEKQQPVIEALEKMGISFKRFYIQNLILLEGVKASQILDLSERDDVENIWGNPEYSIKDLHGMKELNDPLQPIDSASGNISSIGADKVWKELKVEGQGIVVASQDTGVQWNHPALINQYRGFNQSDTNHNFNWHDSISKSKRRSKCGSDTKVPCDDDQHGTHTTGTMVGWDGLRSHIGVAPSAKWIACRNMDSGWGSPATYIECFQFFLAPYPLGGDALKDGDPKLAPHVMNNSWGCPSEEGCKGSEMISILKTLKEAGIFVVVSAGNDGPSCGTIKDQPATVSDYTFTVGANDYRRSGRIADFSSRGPSKLDAKIGPDVTAPGVGIYSSIPGNHFEGGWNGTSMAGPHVAGIVALMWSANPKLVGDVDRTANILRKTSMPRAGESCGSIPGSSRPNNTNGFGVVNAYRAVVEAIKEN